MSGFTDWMDSGIWPLQDQHPRVPTETRQMMVGGRIRRFAHPTDDTSADGSMIEYAKEDEMGTLGDVHPWMFWQTKDREKRGMGSWSMAWSGLVVGGFDNRQDAQSKVLPMRGARTPTGFQGPFTDSGGGALTLTPGPKSDPRYALKTPEWSPGLGVLPRGTMTLIMPGTDEEVQHDIMFRVDPRLVAAGASGPGEAGTLVVDMQPEGELCMAGSTNPGFGGRHARLQALVRVIAMPAPTTTTPAPITGGTKRPAPITGPHIKGVGNPGPTDIVDGGSGGSSAAGLSKLDIVGNMLAINYSKAAADGVGGYGAVFGRVAGGGATGAVDPPGGADPDSPKDPSEFGTFSPKATPGHGVGLLATLGGGGPIIIGAGKQDQHYIGDDADGHPIGSAHIWAGALFWKDRQKDGPMFFEGQYPGDLDKLPGEAMVHLTWDGGKKHNWAGFGERPGLWKWYAEVPYLYPTPSPGGAEPPGETDPSPPPPIPTPPPDPQDPDEIATSQPKAGVPNPTTGPHHKRGDPPPPPITGRGGGEAPGPGGMFISFPDSGLGGEGPPEPGPGRGGIRDILRGTEEEDAGGRSPQAAPGVLDKVGDTVAEDRELFTLTHPLHESFSAIGFRPQRWVAGSTSFEHNPGADREELREDERTRPQVAVMRAWGAQTDSGDWDYTETPQGSRARGGLSLGGILFGPPNMEMEDYLGLGDADVRDTGARSYFTAAPGAALALGTPTLTTGNLLPKSVTFEQDFTVTNEALRICQMSSGSVLTDLIRAELDQSSGKIRVCIEGDGAMVLPRGDDAARPTGTFAPTGGELRISSQDAADVVEFWEDKAGAWTAVGSGGGVTDHGALTGLGDDDHTHYAKLAGDTFVGNLNLTDTTAIRFGTGFDSTITFDGTNTIWNPKATGTGHVQIQGDLLFADNDEVFWGTAKDASILFNGTNMIVDPALVGTGKMVMRDTLLMQDNVAIWFGNSGDGRMSFDGTDVVLDPDAIGGGKLRVTGDTRTDGSYFVGAVQGVTDTISWVNSDGDTVTISSTGGVMSTLEVNPP